jgi:hypothetical protein
MTNEVPKTPAQPPSLADDSTAKPPKLTKTPKPQKSPKQPRPKGVKTNAAELELRHHTVAQWAASGLKKWQAKQKADEEWKIGPRGFEDYWTAANRILLAAADTTPEEEYLRSCAYYDSVMADPTAEPALKLEARKAKDKLTGIQRPRKMAMTGINGEVVNPVSNETVINLSMSMTKLTVSSMSTEDLRKLVEARKVLHAIADGMDANATGKSIGQGKGSGAANHGNSGSSKPH